jgi:hypothetical protein
MTTNNNYNEKEDNNKCYDDDPPNDDNDYNNNIINNCSSSNCDNNNNNNNMNGGGTGCAAAVDELLSKELFKNLCFQEDDDFDDEINGVRCHAINETPELIQTSLIQLIYQLDVVVPDNEKRAYILSQEKDKCAGTSTYINQIDFRLRFLRCELFDAKKAAYRMVKFLNLGLELYGESILIFPPQFSAFNSIEKVRTGAVPYQVLHCTQKDQESIILY